jgi:hypothetical protein
VVMNTTSHRSKSCRLDNARQGRTCCSLINMVTGSLAPSMFRMYH